MEDHPGGVWRACPQFTVNREMSTPRCVVTMNWLTGLACGIGADVIS